MGLWVAFGLSALGLVYLSRIFQGVTGGLEPFDMQNGLTLEEALAQLRRYSEASRYFYGWFAAVDFAFPLLGGLATAASAAFLVRHGLPEVYPRLEARQGFLLWVVPTVFDWLENVAALSFIFVGMFTPSPALAALLIFFKMLKLASLFLTQGSVVVLVGVALARKGGALVRRAG